MPASDFSAPSGAASTDLDFDLELAPDGAGTATDVELDVGKTMQLSPAVMAGLRENFDASATQDVTSDSVARALADTPAGAVAPDFTLNKPSDDPIFSAEPDITLDGPALNLDGTVKETTPDFALDAPTSDELTQSGVTSTGNMIDFNFDAAPPGPAEVVSHIGAIPESVPAPVTPDGTGQLAPPEK